MEGKRQNVSSLFEDLDPDSSPLIKHLEGKRKTGEKICDEDFSESFPLFRKKMEKEFDEITEKFKRLSIDNPEIHDEDELDFCQEDVPDPETQLKENDNSSSIVIQETSFQNNLKQFIIKHFLIQVTLEGINLLFC